MSPHSDWKSETTTREKRPQKRPFCLRAIGCGFRETGCGGGCSQAKLVSKTKFPGNRENNREICYFGLKLRLSLCFCLVILCSYAEIPYWFEQGISFVRTESQMNANRARTACRRSWFSDSAAWVGVAQNACAEA
jgi:hypothetical protein